MKEEKTILIGIGESDDPLPEVKKETKYWVHAAPCKKCGCSGREILALASDLVLRCEDCLDVFTIGLSSDLLHQVTYVYWCNRAKFQSDDVALSLEDQKILESIEKEFQMDYEVPRWAVQIVGGRCLKSLECVNFDCIFNIASQ